MITILGDPQDNFYDNGFLNEKKTLWSGFKRNKLPNPVSFIMPSFMKRPMKEVYYDPSKQCEIFCYTLQLCDRNEEANKQNNMPYIPFVEVNKNTFGENFHRPDLIGTDLDQKNVARKAVRTVTKIMAKDNLHRIISNMEHVIKKFDDPHKRALFVLGKRHNNFSNSRLILNFFFFFVGLRRIFTPAVNQVIFSHLYYHDKCILSLTHPSFNFDRNPQFSNIKKYSSMICNWEEFKADTEKLFMKCLEDFMRENSEMVKTINYTGVGPFIPYLRRTLLKVVSYIGCTDVLSHLFYCNRLEDNICNSCTRLICNSPVLIDSFQKLESLSLPALIVTTHEDLRKFLVFLTAVFKSKRFRSIDYRRVIDIKMIV